jgi:hypothetical protein
MTRPEVSYALMFFAAGWAGADLWRVMIKIFFEHER